MSVRDNERVYWQNLSELTPKTTGTTLPGDEFPEALDGQEMDGQTRRHFMGIMGASMAMASMSGCVRRPVDAHPLRVLVDA